MTTTAKYLARIPATMFDDVMPALRAAADKFWNEEPFAKNGGYERNSRIVRWTFGD